MYLPGTCGCVRCVPMPPPLVGGETPLPLFGTIPLPRVLSSCTLLEEPLVHNFR